MARNFVAASSQYITVGSSTATYAFIETTAVFTWAAWVKLASVVDVGAEFGFWENNNGASSNKGSAFYYSDYQTDDGKLAAFITRGISGNSVVYVVSSNNAINDTNWHHVVVSGNGTTVLIHVDNAQQASLSVTGLSTGNSSFDASIGKIGSVSGYLDGVMAEHAIWDVQLTETERVSLYRGMRASRVRPQSLKHYSPLVRDLIEISRESRTLTNTGTTVADHPRVY